MSKICVYTCIAGNYDNLNEVKNPEKNIDYYCFTNNKNLKSKTWKIVQIDNDGLDDCRLARKIKILGHPTVNSYDIAVWSDADVIWKKDISLFIDTYFKDTSLAIPKHQERNTIYDEAVTCLRVRKDSKEIIEKTLEYYKTIGYPDANGLCASTVYIKKPNDPIVKKAMECWFDMIKNYSRRDQLSFNYAVWKCQLDFKYIDIDVYNNEWFMPVKHLSKKTIETCHVYYGNPNQDFSFDKYYIYPYKQSGDTYTFTATIPVDTNEIEFNPVDIIGIDYKNIIITPAYNQLSIFNSASYENGDAFCTSHGMIVVYGDFKKDQKLSFSIEMKPLSETNLYSLIESQCIKNIQLSAENQKLSDENAKLNKQLKEARKPLFKKLFLH